MAQVKTDTSYNGNFLTVDLDTDYSEKMKQAKDSGDLAGAAQYEALRNAKINYLNSVGQNTGGWQTSNDYTKVYTQSVGKNGAGTNNKGGVTYTDNNTSLSALPSDWKTTKLNGVTYSRDNAGKYYSNGYYVGDGYNANTNEFTYSNQEDARKAAYDQYLMSGGMRGTGEDVYKYIQSKGLVDEAYVNAVQAGTTGQYTSDVIAKAKKEQEAKIASALATQNNKQSSDLINENSFQSQPTTTPTVDTSADDYWKYKAGVVGNQNRLYN